MRKILTMLLTVLMVATLGTVNVYGDVIYDQKLIVNNGDNESSSGISFSMCYGETKVVKVDNQTSKNLGVTYSDSSSGVLNFNIQKEDGSGDKEIPNSYSRYIKINAIGTGSGKLIVKSSSGGRYVEVNVSRANVSVTAPLKADNSVYNGEFKNLLSQSGSVSGNDDKVGEIYYKVSKSGKSEAVVDWTTDPNKVKVNDAGVFTVEWYVKSNDYYNGYGVSGSGITDSASGIKLEPITISKATLSYSGPEAMTGLVYSGETQNLLKTQITLAEDKIDSGRLGIVVYEVYKKDDSTGGWETSAKVGWTEDVNSIVAKDAGTYMVEYTTWDATEWYEKMAKGELQPIEIQKANLFVNNDIKFDYRFDDEDHDFDLNIKYNASASGSESGFVATTQAIYDKVSLDLIDASKSGDAGNSYSGLFSLSGTAAENKYKLTVSNEAIPGTYTVKLKASASGGDNNYVDGCSKDVQVVVEVKKALMESVLVDFGSLYETTDADGVTINNRFINTGGRMYANETTSIKIGHVVLELGKDYQFAGVMDDVYRSGDNAGKEMQIISLSGSKYVENETTRKWYIISSTKLDEQIIVNGAAISTSGSEIDNYYKAQQLDLVYNLDNQLNELNIVVPVGTTLYVSDDKDDIQNAAHRNTYSKSGNINVATLSGSGVLTEANTYRLYYLAIKNGFTSVQGYIDVVINQAPLYAYPVYKEIDASDFDISKYTETGSPEIGIKLMRVEKDGSYHEVAADKCLNVNKLYVCVRNNISEIGAYATAVCGCSQSETNKNFIAVAASGRSTTAPLAQQSVIVDELGNVKMDSATDNKLPLFVEAYKTLVITVDLSKDNIEVVTPNQVYDGTPKTPAPTSVKVETSVSGQYLDIPSSNYDLYNVGGWKNDFSEYVNAYDSYIYTIGASESGFAKPYSYKSSINFVIEPKPITVVWDNVGPNTTYAGQNNDEVLPTASFSGLIGTEKLTPYVEYEASNSEVTIYDAADNHKATASISGGAYQNVNTWYGNVWKYQKSWSGTDTTYASNYTLDKANPNDSVNYNITQKDITVNWWKDEAKTIEFTSGSGKIYDTTSNGIPTASFSGLIVNESLTPYITYKASSIDGSEVAKANIIDVNDYYLVASISGKAVGDNARPENYNLIETDYTKYVISQFVAHVTSLNKTVYRNVGEKANLTIDAPYRESDNPELLYKLSSESDYTKFDAEDYTVSKGSTVFKVTSTGMKELKAGKNYVFKVVYPNNQYGYKNIGNEETLITDIVKVRNYVKSEEDTQTEETVKSNLKAVVNTAIQ